MNKKIKQSLGGIVLLALLLSLVLGSLSSCGFLFNRYVAESKDELLENIDALSSGDGKDREFVYQYLSDLGVPRFDGTKFLYFEIYVDSYFAYCELPDKRTHAVMAATAFAEEYYDEINLGSEAAVTSALLSSFINALGDPYAIYRDPVVTEDFDGYMSGSFGGIGVMIEYNHDDESLMISSVLAGSPAERAGVQKGDYIYAIDGTTVEEIGYLYAVDLIKGEIGSTVELTLLRGEELITIPIVRDVVEETSVIYSIDEEENIGYVAVTIFKSNTAEQFRKAIDDLTKAGVKGIIFDLRDNPGGYVSAACDMISYLIPSGHTIVSYEYKNDPLLSPTVIKSLNDGLSDHTVDLPMVVITDQNTASAAEIFTAAIRDYRDKGLLDATIVGTTTYKKGVVQRSFDYTDGSSITITIAYYNPPSGVNFHGVGIEPDVYVEYLPTEDTQLSAAVIELKKLINAN